MNNYPFEQHIEVFRTLINVFATRGLHYYMIGGQARDLLLSLKNIQPISVTTDIDFAIMVYSHGQFEELKSELYTIGFEATEFPYRIRWKKTNTLIDLLPFGSIALGDDHVLFKKESTNLSVVGFSELLDSLEHYFLDKAKTLSIPIAPLHGIFLLKIISWNDRPEMRQKDLDDLNQILTHYWNLYLEEAYDQHYDIFSNPIDHLEGYGARILGRHLSGVLSKSPTLKARIVGILQNQRTHENPPSPMLLRFAKETEDGEKTIEYSKELLDQILLGLEDQ